MAQRAAAIAVSVPFAQYDGARIESVAANGAERAPLLTGAATRIYRCDECPGVAVEWRVVLRTREPDRLDIVVLAP